ncbi:MAG: hypothetical protein N3A63_04020 [Bacteroidetes bacterium]|nr:hypothetical protein [Bacteroidota bacterium]
MKRILFLIIVVGLVASFSQAQIAYKQGDLVISGMLGLGGVAGLYGEAGMPPISASVDYGYNENISIGALVGIATSEESYFWGGKWKYTYTIIGARGQYHYDFLKNSNIDTYGGIMIGYNIVSSSWEGPGVGAGSSGSYLLYGGFIGGRYYFTPNLAGQLELGYGMGYLTLGIAYKL